MSSNGSWLPGSTGFPSRSVEPEASITWMKTLACIKSSKNLLPNPFPSWAPGTSPATSINSIGSNLFPSIQIELWGLQVTSNSLHGQSLITWATALFASIVVNG